jgi:hypothetical protein
MRVHCLPEADGDFVDPEPADAMAALAYARELIFRALPTFPSLPMPATFLEPATLSEPETWFGLDRGWYRAGEDQTLGVDVGAWRARQLYTAFSAYVLFSH